MPFEPGSVFKVITLSAALETTNLRPDSPINCHGGVLTLLGPRHSRFARRHRGHPHGDGAGEIQQHRRHRDRPAGGPARTCTTTCGASASARRRGIPLPAESRGHGCASWRSWGTTSLASVSMGQEVSVTTLQLAQAASVIANGGLLVKPRLVLKKGEPDCARSAPGARDQAGDRHHHAADDGRRGAADGHRYRKARLEGYSVGGKTGSAQIFDFATHHYTHTYNGSFMGFAPVTNPAIVVVVTLNGTHGAARIWRRGRGAGLPRGGHRSAARAGCSQGPAGRDAARHADRQARRTLRRRGRSRISAPASPNILEDADDEDDADGRRKRLRGSDVRRRHRPEFQRHDDAGGAGGSGGARA